jgi:DNA-binding GntR family transcriptional regulator
MILRTKVSKEAPSSLAAQAYICLKADIFDFQFLPGDRFSENEISERLQMSRTPIREALFRLQAGRLCRSLNQKRLASTSF